MEIDPDVRFPMETNNKTPSYSTLEYALRRHGVRNLAQKVFPEAVRRTLRNMVRGMFGSAKLKMTQSDRARIHNALWDDMQRLRREFGVPVENWGF
jgi:hypothetical protein